MIGTGFGLWWLDPLAAALVSADILNDGASNLKTAILDLVNRRPKKTDGSGWESLPDEVRDLLRGLPWVADAAVRMREEGHVFMGEAFVVPRPGTGDLVRQARPGRRGGEGARLAHARAGDHARGAPARGRARLTFSPPAASARSGARSSNVTTSASSSWRKST